MSLAADVEQRFFSIHGVGVTVSAGTPAVLEAMDLRLRDFRSEEPPQNGIRFEFVTGAGSAAPPPGSHRPVYDTPYGSLHYSPAADLVFGELSGVRLSCEAGRGVASLHCAEFTGLELYLATHPLATIALMELFERRERFTLHAACVATTAGDGVLLAGPSGAGKSTLALALARAGMSFLSDDIVFLGPGAGEAPVVLGFADAVGFTEDTAARFGGLDGRLEAPPTDGFRKRLVRIEDLLGSPARPVCEPRALVFPEVDGEKPSRLTSLDPREALLRLVPDVLLTEPAATQAHLAAVAALLDRVQCYELRSGSDLERACELVGELV
jgi:hypothetical protein